MGSLFPILIVALLIFGTWAQQRLRMAAQPLRLLLAERGERLLGDPELPPLLRGQVEFLLETAFGCHAALIFGFFAVPVILFLSVLNPRRFYASLAKRFTIKNGDTRLVFEELNRLHGRILFANHPIMATLLDFEIAFFLLLSVATIALIHGKMSEAGGYISLKSLIEVKEQEYRDKYRRFTLKAA